MRSLTFKQAQDMEIDELFSKLSETEDSHRVVLDHLRKPIVVFDKAITRVEFVNKAALSMVAERDEAALSESTCSIDSSQKWDPELLF